MRKATTLGLGVFLGTLALYVLLSTLFGAPRAEPGAPWRETHSLTRMNVVLMAIAAFTVGARRYESWAVSRDLREIRPLLRCDEAEFERLRQQLGHSRGRHTAAALVLGGALGVAIQFIAANDFWAVLRDFQAAFLLGMMIVLFALLGKRALDTLALSRAFSELGRRHTRVQLFEPATLAAFGRPGLRLSVNWLVGSAIASLLFVDATAPGVVASVIAATLGLALLCLLLPARGIHVRLREAKHAELRRVREAIAREGEALFQRGNRDDQADHGAAAARLPALVAYEGRVQGVREWPFDTPALLRFAALALLATGSWIGGALVERLLGLALG